MPEEIKKIQVQIVPILKEAGVLKASIFGSVARGESDEKSDIDILVELPDGKTYFDLFDLQNRIQVLLRKKVDIGTYRSVKPMLKERILGEQIKIYEK